MIRALIILALIFLVAAGFAWLAERPGDLLLTWQGYEIRMSLMVAAVLVALVIAAIALIGAVVRAIVRSPRSVGNFFGARRRDRGYRALTRGMVAIGAGDARTARRAAQEARSLRGSEPLVLLLSAQAAQIGGDAAAAYLPTADAGAWAREIARLAEAPAGERARLADAGRRRAAAFTWARTAEGLVAAHREVAA